MSASQPKHHITPEGYQALLRELEQLATVERPRVVNEVADAAAQGDRSENAEYIYGKKRLREIDRRMRFLGKRLDSLIVTDPSEDRGDKIFFGATVELEDLDTGRRVTYQLVGPDETDAARGRISYRSPVGRALMGRSLDDEISVDTPKGTRELLVIEIRY